MIRAAALATVWTLAVCIVIATAIAAWPFSGIAVLWIVFYLGAKNER